MSGKDEMVTLNVSREELQSLVDLGRLAVAEGVLEAEESEAAGGGSLPFPMEAVLAVEQLASVVGEGETYEEAEQLAVGRWGTDSSTDPRAVEHADELRSKIRGRIAREYFVMGNADRLAGAWSRHKKRRVSPEELIAVFGRTPEDPERRELIEWVPGSEEELAEVLSCRRS